MDVERVRGMEGDSARVYFGAFPKLLRDPRFSFEERARRPPTDAVNASLSFVYALLTHDARSALEGVGLDPPLVSYIATGREDLALRWISSKSSAPGSPTGWSSP